MQPSNRAMPEESIDGFPASEGGLGTRMPCAMVVRRRGTGGQFAARRVNDQCPSAGFGGRSHRCCHELGWSGGGDYGGRGRCGGVATFGEYNSGEGTSLMCWHHWNRRDGDPKDNSPDEGPQIRVGGDAGSQGSGRTQCDH